MVVERGGPAFRVNNTLSSVAARPMGKEGVVRVLPGMVLLRRSSGDLRSELLPWKWLRYANRDPAVTDIFWIMGSARREEITVVSRRPLISPDINSCER